MKIAGAQEGNYILSSSPHSHTGYLAIAAKSSTGREEWEAEKRLRQGPGSWWKDRGGGGLVWVPSTADCYASGFPAGVAP